MSQEAWGTQTFPLPHCVSRYHLCLSICGAGPSLLTVKCVTDITVSSHCDHCGRLSLLRGCVWL